MRAESSLSDATSDWQMQHYAIVLDSLKESLEVETIPVLQWTSLRGHAIHFHDSDWFLSGRSLALRSHRWGFQHRPSLPRDAWLGPKNMPNPDINRTRAVATSSA